MTTYSKLIGALIGNFVAIAIAYLATKGIATCTVPEDYATCSVFGLGTAQLTAVLMTVFNSVFVYFFPPNK